tara:strand:- start:872 stop:1654 length:783 start_codon:yes stop_codon:yes gene_type:complete
MYVPGQTGDIAIFFFHNQDIGVKMSDQEKWELNLFRQNIIKGINEIPNLYKYGWMIKPESQQILIKRQNGWIIISSFYFEEEDPQPHAYIETSLGNHNKTAYADIEDIVEAVRYLVKSLDVIDYRHHIEDFRDTLNQAANEGERAYISCKDEKQYFGSSCYDRLIKMPKDSMLWYMSRFCNDLQWNPIGGSWFIQIQGVEIIFDYCNCMIHFYRPGKLHSYPLEQNKERKYVQAFKNVLERSGLLNTAVLFNQDNDYDLQ